MSTNFTGVTFMKQKVTPSDDAIIRRAIFPTDGILWGCELSYSGSTLTMSAGHLLICGRQVKHPSSQNWAVADATSGYARLLLTIDLTRTSEKDVFDQVVDTIEYASSEDGFAHLEQADVNVSGTRYQTVACVVSLGAGGITGIVSRLEKCEAGSGLNFNLVGGLTRPSDPKENMLWAITDEKIASWIFSPSAPASTTEGMLWIAVGMSGPVEFNALKKNAIRICPLSAKQYVSGQWANVDIQIYQSGSWRPIVTDTVLYSAGNFNDQYSHFSSVTPSTAGIQYDAGYISVSLVANKAGEVYEVFGPLPLKGFKSVSADFASGSTLNAYGCILIADSASAGRDSALAKTEMNIAGGESATLSVDLSGLDSGEDLYIYVGYTTNGSSWSNPRNYLRVLNIRMEA